jgi:uncharacterized protein YecE (DUF72 family)
MAQLHAGTSGWAYPSWKPDFYPDKLAQSKFLNYYSGKLNTVEVNFTFRQLVKDTTVEKWLTETPDDFRFGIKAHQVITHIKRLKGTDEFVKRFLGTIEPLARSKKLGPILFQLPPNLKADPTLLKDFLAILPRGVPMAFEFRHPSWFTDATYDLLKSSNIALCVAETEERLTPDVTTADFGYYRYRKGEYSAEERSEMMKTLREHLRQGREVFAYFKHEETPQGALYAIDVLRGIVGGT